MNRPVFYHVKYSEATDHLGSLLDMMRYDSSEIMVPILKPEFAEWLTLVNESGPTTARWHSFHIAVRETVDRRFAISKRPKNEVFVLIRREHFKERYELDSRLNSEEDYQAYVRKIVDLLANERAIPISNAPDGFYLFRFASHAPRFDRWRALDAPIHAAYVTKTGRAPSDIFQAATREPTPLDVVVPSLH